MRCNPARLGLPGLMTGLMTGPMMLAAALGTTGCGSGEPLVGTWRTMSALSGQPSITNDLTFGADQSASVFATTIYPLTFTVNPGCTVTNEASGFNWTSTAAGTNAGVLSYTVLSGMAAITIEGCMNAADNRPRTAGSGTVTTMVLAPFSGEYTISSDRQTLTIKSTVASVMYSTVYTRK